MAAANLDIILADVRRDEDQKLVRHFDAERGAYLGKMCLDTEVFPPQIEVKFDAPDLEAQVFPFHALSLATSHLNDDGLAMRLINEAVDQATASDFERFVKDELPRGYADALLGEDD